jgi:hypothetical protein
MHTEKETKKAFSDMLGSFTLPSWSLALAYLNLPLRRAFSPLDL